MALDIDYPRALLGGLVMAVLVALVVVASTSGAAFGAYNPAWDGASSLRSAAEATGADADLARSTRIYSQVDPEGTVAVILSPDTAYSATETRRVRRFVRRGGTLVVAEDVGPHGNAILDAVGADTRFDGRLLRDERYHYRAPALLLARNVSTHPLLAGVEALTLNYGTAVTGNATVIASTSPFAYADANRDGDLDDAESMRTYPVATIESVGQGRVVAVGDPSLFINAMLDRPGNRRFVENLFDAHERAILDYSHVSGFPPLALALLVLRETPLLQILVGLLGLGAIGLWQRGTLARLRDRLRREPDAGVRPDREDLRVYLERRHPDWDDERIERVIRGVLTREGQSGGDD